MLKKSLPLVVFFTFSVSGSAGAFTGDTLPPGHAATPPDLRKACARECPGALTSEDVFTCVENEKKDHGEPAFKRQHLSCYQAHEKYARITGREEKEDQNKG